MGDDTLRAGHYRTIRVDLPYAIYAQLEEIAEEDELTVRAVVRRAIGNYVHNRTLS